MSNEFEFRQGDPDNPVEYEMTRIEIDNAVDQLTPHEEQAIQLAELSANSERVRTNFQKIAGRLDTSTTRGKILFDSTSRSLDLLVAPNTGFKGPTSKEARVCTIVDKLKNVLMYYPQFSDELFEGYKPVFAASDGTEKVSFAETSIKGFAGKFEKIMVYASQLKQRSVAAPNTFEELLVDAMNAGVYNPYGRRMSKGNGI